MLLAYTTFRADIDSCVLTLLIRDKDLSLPVSKCQCYFIECSYIVKSPVATIVQLIQEKMRQNELILRTHRKSP